MTLKVKAIIVALTTLFCGPLLAQDATLLKDVTIVDIEAGSLTAKQSVLIIDGIITEVGPDVTSAAENVKKFEANGAFMIPGLWDSHVHIFTSATEPHTALPLYLINGVTGIRDMGAVWPIADQMALQNRIDDRQILGPRLILSGAWVDASPGSWPGMFLADSPNEARAVVNRIAREGWAAVKSYSMLDEANYLALAQAATAHGLPLVGHIPERVALGTAIDAGQDGMEHFGRIPMACSPEEGAMISDLRDAMAAGSDRSSILKIMASRNRIILETWDEALCDRVIDRIAARRMHVSPTLVVANFYVGVRPADDSARMRMLPASVREAWKQPDFRLDAMTDEVRNLADATIALSRRTFLLAHAAGVPILASTDASFANPFLFHGFSLLDELDLYVAIGLTPRDALYTATVAPPRFFGLTDQDGTIAPGRRADLVLLNTNPLEGLATLRDPVAVIVGGHVIDHSALQSMRAALIDEAE